MFSWLKKIARMLTRSYIFKRKDFFDFKVKPPIHFESIFIKQKTPPNSEINDKEFYLVKFKRKNVWALFKCPCGCGHVISLSVQKSNYKNWTVKKSKNNRPSLQPSVWQTTGCRSHFWINDGRVYWCSSFEDNL
jgi:beta-xylosidase